MSNLLKIGGENYFIDFSATEKLLTSGSTFKGGKVEDIEITETFGDDGKLINKKIVTKEYLRGKEVDMFRYETIKDMLDIILSEDEDEDPAIKSNKKTLDKEPMSFKLAFNTLLEHGVLNIAEED